MHVGGNWNNEASAGVRAANANNSPGNANTNIGLRPVNCVLSVVARLRLATRIHTHHTQDPACGPNIQAAVDSQ